MEAVIKEGESVIDISPDNLSVLRILFNNYFAANQPMEARKILEKIDQIDSTYQDRHLTKIRCALVQNDQAYIEEMRSNGRNFYKYVIHNFYGEDEQAEKELQLFIANANSFYDATIRVRFTNYLYFSNSKFFEKHQQKDWFQAALKKDKKVYEFLLTQFPRGEEVVGTVLSN